MSATTEKHVPLRKPPLPIREARAGSMFAYVSACGPTDSKQRAVLATIAAFADNGLNDPSVRELSRRSSVAPMRVVATIDELERCGWLVVSRGDVDLKERNRYQLIPKESE